MFSRTRLAILVLILEKSPIRVIVITKIIFMRSLIRYFDKSDHVVVMKPKAIVNRYIRHTFVPDVLGSLPTDIGFIGLTNKYAFLREVVSLVCVFRVFSLNFYIFKFADAYDLPSSVFNIVILIFWIFVLLHWQSCLYWLVPIMITSIYELKRPKDASWIHTFNLWEAKESERYLRCLLHALTIFFSTGFLRSMPKTEEDLVQAIIMQFSGIVILWELISRIMLLNKGMTGAEIKYQNIVEQVKHYMRYQQLSHMQQARIISYYEYRFQHYYFSEQEILKTLSVHMRQEIRMHTCRKLVENVTFFNNLPLSLLARIVSLLKSEIFLTNDVIVRANTPGDSMYFIASGTVAIYTATGKEVCHLEDGAHFGEIALVMAEEMRVASVIAIETCELYRLDRNDFSRTIHPYPMLWDRIKKIAIERHEKTMIFSG